MQQRLGTLASVDVRSHWANEAAEFTPWLAEATDIAKLGEAIGLELEVEHTEVAVGPFAADILARVSATGGYVVIENQLSKTDHDHLGKAITYAAVLGAKTVVWVAPNLTEEHRKALDWLNDNSSDDLSFYGVQLELWSIDGSAPAVRFNVVCRPADMVRHVAAVAHGEISESKKLQFEWWSAFRDALLAKKAVPSAQSPRPQFWYDVALGRTGIHISATANTFDKRIGLRVYMMGRFGAASALAQLLEQRAQIESEIGTPLVWDPNPTASDKVIATHLDADLTRRDKWPEYLEWLVNMTIKFRRVFGPRVKALVMSVQEESEPADA
jgi:hypothetical protein